MTGVVEVKTERQVEHRDDIADMHDKKTEHTNGEVVETIKTSLEGKKDMEEEKKLLNGTSNGLNSSSESLEKSDSQENVTKDEDGEKEGGTEDATPGMVVIQDTGFVVSIEAPGIEPFDLAVSSMELVQEIFQVLIDKEDTCHRTCFTLQLDGVTMDNFAELKNIEGLKEGSTIKVVEEPYTVREARIHVRHVRDLLKSVDNQDAYNGVDCNSLSFLNAITGGDILDKKTNRPESVDCTPPDYIMPGSKDRPITPLHPKELKPQPCLKVLTYSGWNPPPGNRKMHGDLLYLYVVTLEDKRYHLTASTRGFYVNQSTQDEFNPRPAAQKHLCHSLIDVLSQISPSFKRNFQILLKKRAEKHPFERVATPYQVYSWMVPNMEHCVDSIRAEDAFSSRLGYEEHIPGQTRDWNEELQTTRELPQKNLPERLIRERAIFKVHSDFVVAATRGAMAVIDGNIMAINPGEDSKMQMFLWNNIFFSLGFDIKDHYKDFGGDAAAYTAPGIDLQGVKAYSTVDPDGLYTLGTVVVDYRGYRVTAQSIIPGILEREQEQSVVYGSVDFGKTVVTCDKYKELLGKTTQALKIRPHTVVNEKGEEIELYSSVECKGIIGNDGRHYILDLLRTFPPDINYLPDSGEELSEEMKKLGYPRKQQHLLVCLRKELVDAFVENRYISFVRQAALLFQQWRLQKLQEQKDPAANEEGEKEDGVGDKKTEDGKSEEANDKKTEDKEDDVKVVNSGEELEEDEAKKIVESFTKDSGSFEENSRTIMKKAARAVDSLSDTEFNITFNPDLFQPHVVHAQPESETHLREKLLVKSAAEFLVMQQIPSFIRDCLEHVSSPIDGFTLIQALHHNGINVRYLGKVMEMIESHETLSYLRTICVSELMCRATKHLFKTYTQGVEMMGMSAAISHFLNCLLGSFPTPHTQFAAEELQSQRSRKRSRRKNKGALLVRNDNLEWASEQPKTLWRKIAEEVSEYYGYTLSGESIDAMFEVYGIQKVSLLRRFCQMVGIQIQLREYTLDSKTRQAFYEEDIINVFPIVKNIHPKATDAYHVFTSGQNKIQQGLLSEGFDLISEALNLLNNVYGAMHPEIAACARLLARLNYIMGDYPEALVFQQRAVLMSERVHGIDHPNTITEYAHLALYCLANNQISTSLKLMYRARYLALVCHGENHPEVGLFDSNIGLILHAVGEFDLSLRFFQKSLELNTKFFGATSLKVAMSYHLIARTYSCKGDFRTALQNEKEAYTIYKQVLGEVHERTRESTECLKHLTQQAVKFQKTMNQISKGERISNMPPLQIHTPSLSNVLDTLNLINGIVFVHISQEDIEKFRLEMVQRQQATDKSVTDCCGEDDHTSHGLPSSKSAPDDSTTEDKTDTVLDTNENVTKDGELSDEASR